MKLIQTCGYIVLISLLLYSCTAGNKEDALRSAEAGKCEESKDLLSGVESKDSFFQKAKKIFSTPLSVISVGGVAILETALYVGGGVVIGGIVCAPIIALEAAGNSRSKEGLRCFIEVGTRATAAIAGEGNYSFTKGFWDKTKTLRVESYDSLSLALRKTTDCFISRNSEGDLNLAKNQIGSIRDKSGLWPHLSQEEKNEWALLESKISKKK